MADDTERERRAARRLATYSGHIVSVGEDKPALYRGKTSIERLALQTALVHRLAALRNEIPRQIPRADWPGEVFDIDGRNRGIR